MTSDYSNFYKGKIFAGPMVRASCLPFRLTCLDYGADGVYGPATSCDSILSSHIEENNPRRLLFGTPSSSYVHFHSVERESGKLVFQILAHDSNKAIQAVNVVSSFADAIDLNCGCPESFATSKGDGSALMNDPQTVSEIISSLKRNFSIPISVKHRIHSKIEHSIQFAVACQNAGASAIAVHGRLKEQKHKGSVAYDDMKLVFEHINVAKIGNGGVKNRKMANEMIEKTGCDSIIISGAAIKNPSCFSNEMQDPITVARKILINARENGCYDRREWRWIVNAMIGKHRLYTKSPEYERMSKMETLDEFDEFFAQENPFK